MSAFYTKMLILTWKCQILRRRNIIITFLELVIPILIFILQSYVYHVLNENVINTGNIPKSLKTALAVSSVTEEASKDYDYLFSFMGDFDLGYTPENKFTENIMGEVTRELRTHTLTYIIKNESKHDENELNTWLKEETSTFKLGEDEDRTPSMGIVFSAIDSKNHQYTYTIRTTCTSMKTNDVDSGMTLHGYLKSMFLGVQMEIDTSVLRNIGVNRTTFYIGELPSQLNSVFIVTILLFLFLVFAFLFLVVSCVKDVVVEKECGTKELMKVMGVDSWMIWFHWFVYIFMVQIPVIIFASIILTVWKPVVIDAGFFIVFFLFLLFIMNLTALLFVVSCFFYKSTTALTISLISWFVFNMILFIKVIANPMAVSPFTEFLSRLFPLVNLCWALSSLWSYKAYGVAWKWSLLFEKGFTDFQTSVGGSILSFILSTVICIILLTYLDALFPGPYGVPKPFTFIYNWIRDKLSSEEPFEESEIKHDSPENFEPPGKNAKVGIMLRGIQKKYGFLKKNIAVENVDLDIYEGEIMALLGHNGAGKTTTMSMITGMTKPTRGVIAFQGKDITVNKREFRESLGLCPQHNLYFPKLTVLEHLMFYGMLKGATYTISKKNGKTLLYSLNMLEKASTLGSKLSGGMKRRLCLAVSLTGDPKVLILDEPTSGLDPETRRSLWDIILNMRGERIVLITTHFMEEADVLGDRIAIMDRGKVVCCGTTMFLKKLFGAGYQIHILKSANASVDDITNLIKQNIEQPLVKEISKVQVDYVIKEEFIEKFPSLFSSLEKQKNNLDITGITVTCASMEDVFLKVADLPLVRPSQTVKESEKPLEKALNIDDVDTLSGKERFVQQFEALIERRYIHRRQHIISLLVKILFLCIFMLFLALTVQIEREKYKKQKPIDMDFRLYPKSAAVVASDVKLDGFDGFSNKVAKLMHGKVITFNNTKELEDYLIKESNDGSYNYNRNILFSLTFFDDGILMRYHQHYNPHALAIAINYLSNFLLLSRTNGSGLIRVINHPYINTDVNGVCDKKYNSWTLEFPVVYSYLLLFAIAFVILLGEVLWLIVEERVTGFKHQLFLAGASPPLYWLVNMAFDLLVYLVGMLLILIIFLIFGPKIFLTRLVWMGLLLSVVFLQGLAAIPLTYIYSLLMNSAANSFAVYNVVIISFGVFPALVVSTGLFKFIPFISFPVFMVIAHLLCLNPIAAGILCMRYILKGIVFEEFCRVCTDKKCPMDSGIVRIPTKDNYSGMLSYFYVLVFTAIMYPLFLLLLDCGLIRRILLLIFSKEPDFKTRENDDDDVKLETQRVEAFKYEGKETPLRVESLEKKYMFGPKAVDKVSFLVMKGECFGLLGVNGAGKSTTFKMLTAEIMPNKGDAYVDSCSMKSDRTSYMSSVGYCPQIDAILPSLSGTELLTIIGRIRGVPPYYLRDMVTLWLDMMGILEYGDKRCGTYSGGTKRKLSTAMALIGAPEVVFMDEPTTGVDPASRRKLWTVIKQLQKQGQAIVLTSHSMEECEALCTRLTIMVSGRMKCVGNVEYLKSKFGTGYNVQLKLTDHSEEDMKNLKEDFSKVFPENSIKDEHETMMHYNILMPKLPLSQLFSDLLQFKRDHPIVSDFTATNTTLEELFLSFANQSHQPVVVVK